MFGRGSDLVRPSPRHRPASRPGTTRRRHSSLPPASFAHLGTPTCHRSHPGTARTPSSHPTQIETRMRQHQQNALRRRNYRGGRSAAEHLIFALRCLYKRAVADGIIAEADNPAAKVAKPRRLDSTRTALADDRLAEIIVVAGTTGDDPELDLLIIRFHVETAARRGGLLALRPRDLDVQQCLVMLQDNADLDRTGLRLRRRPRLRRPRRNTQRRRHHRPLRQSRPSRSRHRPLRTHRRTTPTRDTRNQPHPCTPQRGNSWKAKTTCELVWPASSIR